MMQSECDTWVHSIPPRTPARGAPIQQEQTRRSFARPAPLINTHVLVL